MTARLGSMFSGCDGMWLGVESVIGGRLAWHAEVDKDAAKVLAHRYPGVPNLGDVTAVDWSTVEPVDVLIGGPPCQAVSSAGKGLGSADPRWMWPEALRAMAELRPALCLWENPSRLLTGADKDEEDDGAPGGDPGGWGLDGAAADPRWFGWLLGEMAALGFDAWWTCLRSSDVGAPHGRDRVFLACAPADAGGAGAWGDGGAPPVAQEPAGRGEPGHAHAPVAGGSVAPAVVGDLLPTPRASANENRQTKRTPSQEAGQHGRSLAAEVCSLLPTPTVGDSKSARNSTAQRYRTPPPGVHAGDTLTDAVDLLPTPCASDGSGGRHARNLSWEGGTATRPSGAKASVSLQEATDRWGRYAAAVERWERLFRPAPEPTDEKGRLNPALPEWMMGLPEGWVTQVPGVSRTAQLRILGNSCQPQVAAAATSALLGAWVRAEVPA